MRTLLTALQRHAEVARQRLGPLLLDRPRVAYVGGHGDRNLGDDVLFEAATWVLPGYHLETFRFPPQERRLALVGLSGPRYFHQFVLGGGTLINPYGSITVRAGLRQGLPAWTLGTGVGSAGFNMRRHLDLSEWASLLRDFRAVGVRGPLSQATLEQVGVHRAEVVGDLALALARPTLTAPAEEPRRFAVNITLPPPHEPEGYGYGRLEGLERALRELLGRGWEPVFIAMHRVDHEPLRRLMAAVGRGGDTLHHPYTAEQYLQLVAPCTLALVVRLHAAVLACCAGVPPLMLGYRDKCLDFMASMGLGRWHVDLLSPEEPILPRALELAEAADGLRAPVLERARHYQRTLRAYVQRVAGC